MSFKKFDGSTWQPITPKKLKGIPYTGTLPAVLTGTKAGYLQRYKIYGNTEQAGTPTPENPIVPRECGERTENLFDENTITRNRSINYGTGATFSSQSSCLSDYIDINDAVALSILISNTSGVIASQSNRGWCFFDAQQNFISGMTWTGRTTNSATFTVNSVPENAKYLRFSVDKNIDAITLIEGSTAPTEYVPYGYKLPMTSAGQDVDIYIGDDTLSTDEYVDSGTGKIYRMVDGVLTQADPPIPFPQIPTSAGSTTISWAGEGLAPSEFDSIQEWVDIPTYTYTNGAWVEDN